MSRPHPLPHPLSDRPFTVAEALRAGVDPARLLARDLQRPHHGVRSRGLALATLEGRAQAYQAKLRPGAMLSHSTAAVLWGMPLPLRYRGTTELHVTVVPPSRAPAGSGVTGHRRTLETSPVLLRGMSVTDPALTWAMMAPELEVWDLIAVGDFVVTGSPFEGIPPLAGIDDLRERVTRLAGAAGHRRRLLAIDRIQVGPLSRPESLLLFLVEEAGLPKPVSNLQVGDDRGVVIAMVDVAWPEFRVALEYEGRDHAGVGRFRKDVGRIESIVDQRWSVTRVAPEHLFDEPSELVRRIASRLRAGGWRGRAHSRRIARIAR